MKRILVITWFFPPVNSSEGLVTYKLLNNSKFEYDVFTQKDNISWSYGNSDDLPMNKNIRRIYSKATNINDWPEEAIEFFKKHQDDYDIVMTRSMPPESHKIGLEIKKIKPSIKLICSFGDPIAMNPYSLYNTTLESPYSIKRRYEVPMSIRYMLSIKRMLKNIKWNLVNKKRVMDAINKDVDFEKEIFDNASAIIFNSDEQKEYMTKNYDIKDKGWIIPHSYEPSLYPKGPLKKDTEKIVFSYYGHLDNIRNVRMLLEALSDLYEEHPDLEDKAVFNFYGNMSELDKIRVMNYNLSGIVRYRKSISFIDSLNDMKKSDWLLFVDANLINQIDHNIFFAAKLADYIGAKKNIFGITMVDGPSANILRSINALCLSFSKESIKNYLYLIIYKGYQNNQNEKIAENYSSINVAKEFDRLVEKNFLR